MPWNREHRLTFHRPLPASEREDATFAVRWTGPAVMGVLNLTPDSFSDGGALAGAEDAVRVARAMAAAGADWIDVGGESTRPGATPVPPEEEAARILPTIRALAAEGDLRISVDTRRAAVAARALAAGAHLVNDVSGLRDPAMAGTCAEAGAPLLIGHMRGEPATMQDDPRYLDVADEVVSELRAAASAALRAGVPSVAVDPGFGFGKRDEHNLALIDAVARLAAEGWPVVFGASRKGTIGRIADETRPERRDPGTLILHAAAARAGAAVLRVHDVAAQVQALRVQRALETRDAEGGPLDRITLSGMEFHGYHGVFEEEARFGARFRVDLEMQVPLPARDELARTVDYARIYALVAERTTVRRFRLIESLAHAIADAVLAEEPRVRGVVVWVHKPHAPLPGVVRDVTVEVRRDR